MSDRIYDAIDALPDEDPIDFERNIAISDAVSDAVGAVVLGYAAEFADRADREEFFRLLVEQLPDH